MPQKTLRYVLFGVAGLALSACSMAAGGRLSHKLAAALTSQSAAFIENRGQWDAQALYLSRVKGLNFWLTSTGPVFDFNRFVPTGPSVHGRKTGYVEGHVVKMSFVNSQPTVISGRTELPGKFNYFVGDKSTWASNVPAYSQAVAEQPYAGVSVRYSIEKGAPRYDVLVAPGADISQVGMKIEGAYGSRVLPNGNLQIKTSLGTVEERGLTAYQGSTQVPCRMVMEHNVVHFDVGNYDTSKPLVIDPLVYSTYFGGQDGDDVMNAVVTDAGNNIYIAGQAGSTDFPVTSGAYQKVQKAKFIASAFVAKMNQTESALVYSTLIGGTENANATAIAVDKSLNAYITGNTTAYDYPTTSGAFQKSSEEINSANAAFVTKLNPGGSALLYSTYVTGTGGEFGEGIAVDASGDAFIDGYTYSTDFPVSSTAFQKTLKGVAGQNYTGFVSKLNPAGSALVYSSYLGGTGHGAFTGDACLALAIDTAGDAYACGSTFSSDFPLTASAFQKKNNSYAKTEATAFVSKVNPTGTALLFSTFLGGSSEDKAIAITLDSSNDVVVGGSTSSLDFPVTASVFEPGDPDLFSVYYNVPTTGFVSKLASTGSALTYSTYLGGSGGNDVVYAVKLNSLGDVFVTGETNSADFPTTSGAFQTTLEDSTAAFVAELNSNASSLVYGTFLGGAAGGELTEGYGLAVNTAGEIVTVGGTISSSFPVTSGTINPVNSTGFVTTLSTATASPAISDFNLSPASVSGGLGATGTISLTNATTAPLTFKLTSTGPATFPSDVVIQAGATTVSFTARTEGVNALTTLSITATSGALTATASTKILPTTIAAISLSETEVTGGHPVSAHLSLSAFAGSPYTSVALTSSSTAVILDSPVLIYPGNASGQTTVGTKVVSATTQAVIVASVGTTKVETTLVIQPYPVALLTVPASSVGPATIVGKITLSGPAGPTGDVISLASSSPDATVPKTVTVPAGETTVTFNITVTAVTKPVTADIVSTFAGKTKIASVVIEN
jgi:hypothetical protein